MPLGGLLLNLTTGSFIRVLLMWADSYQVAFETDRICGRRRLGLPAGCAESLARQRDFVIERVVKREYAITDWGIRRRKEVGGFEPMRQVLIAASVMAALSTLSSAQETRGDFSGVYASLKAEQKTLVDDWVQRFSATVGKRVDPAEAYNNLSVSTRTTFNAVTHALLTTRLTDSSGRDFGSAIQIVAKIDTVSGEVPGARGDEQFRIYVQLKSDALDLLDKSQQFTRKDDNTVYHKGYPTCYRSKPAVPSIQVSAARDKTRADIDVDYKSSGFPKALVNGHLSASNSDVRAGQNDEVHNRQWSGLNNWWRSLLSLPPLATKTNEYAEANEAASKPSAKAKAKPAEAVYDLLNVWLVERKPENILSYFAQEAYTCAELESGEKQDRGMARIKLLMALQRANERIGEVAQLSDISTAVQPAGTMTRTKLVQHPYQSQFTLYDIRQDAAEQFNCVNRLDPTRISPKAASSKSFGKYYGAVFRLGNKNLVDAVTLATLWTRGPNDYWRVISYDVDPVWETYRAPNTALTPPPAAPTEYTDAPPQLVSRVDGFLEAWLVKHNLEQASTYLSDKAVNACGVEDAAPRAGSEAQAQLRAAMQGVVDTVGNTKDLDKSIMPPSANHPDIKIVKHAGDKTFALVSIPEYMGAALDCAVQAQVQPADSKPETGAKNYGKYYALGFRLKKTGEDSGVLWAVWTQEDGAWKISSYTVLTP